MVSVPKEGEARDTVVNFHAILRDVIDGYRQKTSITHGVQKDAIQNGWDARKTKKGKEWSFTFELVEGGGRMYLCMTDTGTTGLTGGVRSADGYLKGLPPEERWAAFEGLGFTKDDVDQKRALGSRGRGKFIFVAASEAREINYDTLTEDENYRYGGRQITLTGSPVKHFDDEKARERIRQVTGGLVEPLTQVGTRIIIIDPIDELVDAIKTREFDFMVGETWWEIIKKYDARIIIKAFGEERIVSVPSQFDLPHRSKGSKHVWLRKGVKEEFGDVSITIKDLHLVCRPGEEIHEDLRGISIQRGGMKICTVESVALPDDLRQSIYGYVTLDEAGELLLKEHEGLEHNSLSFRYKAMKDLKRWLQSQVMEFAKSKLGYRSHPEKERREKQKAAERRALSAINRIANQLELRQKGPSTISFPRGSRGPTKPIRLVLSSPQFPNPSSLRVDYGQVIEDISAAVLNDTCEDVPARVRVFIRYGKEVVLDLLDSNTVIGGNSEVGVFGPQQIEIKETSFEKKGRYILTVRITNSETAERLDQKGFSFYVETEPMARGIFESFSPFALEDDEYRYSIGYTSRSSAGGLVLNYNVLHPSYMAVEDDDDDATEHLFRFAAMELVSYDLSSESPRIVDFDQKRGNDIDYMLERYTLAMGKLFYYFHKGRS